ncbi:efflux RND transporter permease subunit [Pseudoalteromonas ruthenica]|uniref:efflux RND transporter permease subunit n=1 Tax=Pseudoalteromonas ruthenica TaxID=151081 RepID=UPI00241F1E8A|nr:efflux RND transporter permease subunit [Pseudoalteromonas ruthenica]
MNALDKTVKASLNGPFALVVFIVALVLGALALSYTPREEEPQITVPMLDITVAVPGIEAPQVERLVTIKLEKLLAQIPGVEHIYSTTANEQLVTTLRFEVGHSREQALIDTYAKLYAYQDTMPQVVKQWQIKPISVDDVAIVMLGLYSEAPQLYNDYDLTRMAQELATNLQRLADTSEVKVVAGRKRSAYIYLDISALNAHQTTVQDVLYALEVSNQLHEVGRVNDAQGPWRVHVQAGDALRDQAQLSELVVNVVNGQAVRLDSVAEITVGPSEPSHYQWLQHGDHQQLPLVTLSVAKQGGSNAVAVADAVHREMARLQQQLLPPEVKVVTLRDYGQTANDKVNNLGASLAFAIITVVLFIGVFLGWRPAIVIALALPICYGLTLTLDWTFGYTINRVTLFALILALGLLVDDPITGIDNISRYLNRSGDRKDNIVAAISEIRTPLLMSTLTIMVAFFPLAFITGMMGPYMAPMAFNVPISVALSTLVAFFVTPWLAMRILKPEQGLALREPSKAMQKYTQLLGYILSQPRRSKWVLYTVLALFVFSASLPVMRAVPLKLLPYDNKSEVQVLIDMPEGTALEHTAALTRQVQHKVWQLNEVKAIAAYVGQPSSMDFNGMVRGYYRRVGEHQGELRVLLHDKSQRQHQSHAVVLRLRDELAEFNQDEITIKVIEVPPGPPVLSTLVAEVYAKPFIDAQQHREAARQVMARLRQEPHVVEVDSSMAAAQTQLRFVTNTSKAALSAVASADIATALRVALKGQQVGQLYVDDEINPLPIEVTLPYRHRTQTHVGALQVKGQRNISQRSSELGLSSAPQPMVALSELGEFNSLARPQPIVRKDLQRVIYVMAELNGRTPAEVIADVSADKGVAELQSTPWQQRTFVDSGGTQAWRLGEGIDVSFSGEGEWRITIDVFRDMGIAFAFALAAILVLLRVQTKSMSLALIIMSAIPLTIIGIMPGFWLLNQLGERAIADAPEPVLFTATAMIGMIALAGIVIRNSLILVEFIEQSRRQGEAIKTALINAVQVRMRPVLLTAGTTLLGNIMIIFDPVFSGLAIAIIFGILASTLFTLLVVPLVYYLVFAKEEANNAN